MTEIEVVPAVGGGNGVVHLDVEVSEILDIGGSLVGIVETVVRLGKTLLACAHDLVAMATVAAAN